MFCENCGKPVEDGRTFCPECENSIIQEAQAPSNSQEIILNYEGNMEKKKPGKGKIITIAVAIVAVLGILVALLWKPIAGLFGNGTKFASAQEHFAYVEGKRAQNLADSIAAGYGDFLAAFDSDLMAGETQMHIQFNEDILALLGETAQMELTWLDDIMLNLDYNADAERMQYLLTMGLGDTGVISADVVYDLQNYVMWIAFPELSSTYLEIDMSETAEYDEVVVYDMESVRQVLELLPSEQVMRSLLNRYLTIAVSNISDVSSKTQTVTVEGISQKCTVLEAKIDQQTLINILVAVLEEAKNDEELLDALREVMEYAEPGMGDMLGLQWSMVIDAAIAQIKDSAADMADPDDYILWTDFVDSKNNIIGRCISDSDTNDAFRYLKVTSGKEFAYEMNLMDVIVLSGTGTDHKDLINGEYMLEVDGEEILSVELIDIDSKKLDNGDLCGTLRIRPSDEVMQMAFGLALYPDIALDFIFDTSGASNETELALLVSNQVLASITVEAEMKEATPVREPSNTISVYDETALEAWINDWDFDEIVDNIEEAGVPTDYVDALEEFLELLLEGASY